MSRSMCEECLEGVWGCLEECVGIYNGCVECLDVCGGCLEGCVANV